MEGEGAGCYGGSVLSVDHKVMEGVFGFLFRILLFGRAGSRGRGFRIGVLEGGSLVVSVYIV